MRSLLVMLAFAAAIAAGTVLAGWLAVPVLALAFGLLRRDQRAAAWQAAAGALAGWSALLVLAASRGPLLDLARQLGAVMQVPWLVVVLATLLFPAVLAWSGARVTQGVASVAQARREAEVSGPAAPVAERATT